MNVPTSGADFACFCHYRFASQYGTGREDGLIITIIRPSFQPTPRPMIPFTVDVPKEPT